MLHFCHEILLDEGISFFINEIRQKFIIKEETKLQQGEEHIVKSHLPPSHHPNYHCFVSSYITERRADNNKHPLSWHLLIIRVTFIFFLLLFLSPEFTLMSLDDGWERSSQSVFECFPLNTAFIAAEVSEQSKHQTGDDVCTLYLTCTLVCGVSCTVIASYSVTSQQNMIAGYLLYVWARGYMTTVYYNYAFFKFCLTWSCIKWQPLGQKNEVKR